MKNISNLITAHMQKNGLERTEGVSVIQKIMGVFDEKRREILKIFNQLFGF